MTTTISPAALNAKLTAVEVNGDYAPDCRAIIREERIVLTAALQSGDAKRIAAAKAEALRVCEMWGVK